MSLDVFCVDGTKLDDSFPNLQFILEKLQTPTLALQFLEGSQPKRRWKVGFRKSIAERLENLQTKICETSY